MTTMRRIRRSFARATLLRCPACGGRPVFTSWLRMLPTCPTCGIRFERGESGYWLGAYFVNLMMMETVFVVWFAGFLYATWPEPPWASFLWLTIALMLVVPFALFPWSRLYFLAFDLLIREPTEEDFLLPEEGKAVGR